MAGGRIAPADGAYYSRLRRRCILNRREFHRAAFLLSAGAALAPRLAAVGAFGDTAAEAEAVYRKAIVIDTLCAPFLTMDPMPDAAAVAAVMKSGVTAVNCTVSERTYEGTLENLDALDKLLRVYPNDFTRVTRAAEISLAKQQGKLGILPGFQYASFLESDPGNIAFFRKRGVRIMQLTYNTRGGFGDGCLERANGGLTKAGADAVHRMNALGVGIDLSHCGYRTTSDAIALSAKPVLITHSGCNAVYVHPRNKPDAILRALANRGGYFGVYLMPYLVASPTVPTRQHVLDHLIHAINVCGADHVGIGSDGALQAVYLTAEQKERFDADIARRKQLGIGAPGEDRYPFVPDLNGPDHMEAIARELAARGQPSSVIEKVLGANFARVIAEIWGSE